ncbi:MAG: TonB-dependent receptor [Acidobacteriaceae bacterium]|nr:TonB-dependent receptor [Acidobacteriaceae bacterium]
MLQRVRWGFWCAIVWVSTTIAFAQQGGSVSGQVSDPTGATVAGASVTLTSTDRGSARAVKTNERGEYLFSNAQPGLYTLTVTAPSFQTYIDQDLKLETDQNVRMDARLILGSVQSEVIVTSSGSEVDTRSATIGVLIEKKLVEDLPIDAGNVVNLAALLPGVASVNAPATFTAENSGPTYSVSGSRSNQNLFLLDGALWNNLYYNTGLNYPPRQALQEVSVQLNNYKAQFGRSVGSVFNVITKAGTDTLHGSVWEYAQNSAFNSSDYFTKINPHLVSNQFGFTLGGPILRDKLFYQLTYQDLRISGTNIGNIETPTLDERGMAADGVTPRPCSSAGYFAGMGQCAYFGSSTDAGTKAQNRILLNPLYDTGTGYASYVRSMINTAYTVAGGTLASGQDSPCVNVWLNLLAAHTGTAGKYLTTPEIPSVCFSPVVQNVIHRGYLPLPTQIGYNDVPVAVTQARLPRNDQNALLRLDYQYKRHSIDARYYQQNADDHSAPGVATGSSSGGSLGPNAGNANYEITYNTGKNRLGSIGDTWVITPNLFNVARAAYKRYVNVIYPQDQTSLQDLGSAITIPGVPSLPYFGVTGRFTLGTLSDGYQYRVNGSLQIDDSVSYQHSHHNIMFGAEWLRLEYLNHTQTPGELSYASTYSDLQIADFMQGLVKAETLQSPLELSGRERALYLFVQDDWRALPRLTISVGLRYELPWQWYQPKGHSETFIPGYQSQVFTNAPGGLAFYGDKSIRKSLVPTDYNEWQPRLGIAYDLFGNGKTSIRGGFGVFFDAINANVVGAGQPYYYNFQFSTPPGGTSEPLLNLIAGNPPGIPSGYAGTGTPLFLGPYSVFYPDPNFRSSYTMAGNVGFQQQAGKFGVLEMNYVLKLGRKLSLPVDRNPAIYDCSGAYYKADPVTYCTGANATLASYSARARYPGYNASGSSIVDLESVGTANYNGLQIQYRRRTGKNLTLIGSYTYSRSLDEGTNGLSLSNAIPNVDNISTQYGPSDSNVKHNGTMGWALVMPTLHRGIMPLRAVLNGWEYSGIYSVRTGLPINVVADGDPNYSNEPNQRPSLMPGANPKLPSGRHRADKINNWFDGTACNAAQIAAGTASGCVWLIPGPGQFGNVSRNFLVGPAFTRIDMSAQRFFQLKKIRDTARLTFRADAFNVFNTVNLAQPKSTVAPLNNVQAGYISASTGSNTVAGPVGRRLQLSATFYF